MQMNIFNRKAAVFDFDFLRKYDNRQIRSYEHFFSFKYYSVIHLFPFDYHLRF